MDITYSSEHCPNDSELKELFSTVEWQVSRHIDRLSAAMYKYDNLITAWDGARLVGLVCSLDDGAVTAYINYLIVHPDYQRMGIGIPGLYARGAYSRRRRYGILRQAGFRRDKRRADVLFTGCVSARQTPARNTGRRALRHCIAFNSLTTHSNVL